MRPVVLNKIEVREIMAALDSRDELSLVQYHVNRETCLRYLLLSDQQYWRLMEFLKTTSHVAHSN